VPRALVVDDDAMILVAVEVRLQRQIFGVTGFEATIAGDGEAGVHARQAATFQAATCDGMPIDILPSPDLSK
jgi:DNA-binding response OmpR family regulator